MPEALTAVGGIASLIGASNQADAASSAADAQSASAQAAINEQRRQFDINQQNQEPWRLTGQNALKQLAMLEGVPFAGGGATYDQLRAQLAPQFTTTKTVFGEQDPFNLPQARQSQNITSIDEAGLAAAIQQRLAQQQAQQAAQAKQPGYGSGVRSFSLSDFQTDPGYNFRLQQGLKQVQNSAAARGMLGSGSTLKAINDYAQGSASDEYQNAYNRFFQQQGNKLNRLSSLAGVGQSAVNQLGNYGQNYANSVGDLYTQQGNARAAGTIGQANAFTGGLQGLANTFGQYQQNQMMQKYLDGLGGNSGGSMNSPWDYTTSGAAWGGYAPYFG